MGVLGGLGVSQRIALGLGLALAVALGIWGCLPLKPAAPGPTTVRGYIAVMVGERKAAGATAASEEEIHLPSVHVTLRHLGSGSLSPESITDLSGRFTTQVATAGSYELCWKADGFGGGCLGKPIALAGPFQNLSTVSIPLPKNDRVAIYGTVRLSDGGSPRAFDALGNINAFARVSLVDAQGKTQLEVALNNHDRYVLPGALPGQTYQLRIREENYDRRQGLRLASAAPTQRFDFTMLNSAPRIEPVIARDGVGVRIGTAAPGSTVELFSRVTDREGDSVRYFWRVSAGTLSSPTAARPTWQLPSHSGKHAATLVAFDGRGGYASQSVAVTVDPRGLEFSGRVTGTDVPVLANAQVDVNGVGAVTDAAGRFRLFVPDKRRFVLTIRKPGYGFASVIYYDAVQGGTWQLVRASVSSVDPTRDIDVTGRRTRTDCPGAPSDRLAWANHPALAKPHYQDGRGNFVSAPKEVATLPGLPRREGKPTRDDCGPGVTVKIPADSLVDANGQAPVGAVTVQLSSVDLQSPNQMPGNYSVVQGNSVGVMQSYGAGIVEIYAGATKYNLRAGASATLIIPVDQAQIDAGGALPPTIPLLDYDEPRGVWRPDGQATLASVAGRPAYVAKVTHFTAYNSDLIKQDQSCVALQNQGMPNNYDLEVTIPQTGGAAPVKRLFPGMTGGNFENVLLNLPKTTNIVLVPIRTTDPDPLKNQLPMGVFVVNTGAPQNPNWPTVQGGFANEPQGPPYYTTDAGGQPNGACSTKAILKDLGAQFYPDPSQLLTGAFLHGLQAFAAVNLSDTDAATPADANQALRDAVAAASQAYRKAIDPRGLRSTLSCFKVTNGVPLKAGDPACAAVPGFTPPAVLVETKAVYANTIDLGFGREMHCVSDAGRSACYVSNYQSLVYTGPGQGSDVSKANAAVDGLNGVIAKPDATVAMEFSTLEDFAAPGAPVTSSDAQRVVKFFVFNADGLPVDKANLDGLGERPVPQLCMVCHGGTIPNASGSTTTQSGVPTPVFRDPAVDAALSRADVKLNSKFLPFDLRSFSYSTQAGFDRASQEAAFKALNDIAKAAPPPDAADPTSSVIDALNAAWYPGNATPQQNAAPPLWSTNAQRSAVYLGAVAPGCRTCHVANAAPTLRFDRAVADSSATGFDDVLGAVQLRVCKQHVMPHARRTHDLFWTSINPSQPAQLQVYGDAVKAANPSVGWQVVGSPGVSDDLLCGNEYTQGGGVIVTNTAFSPVNLIFSSVCAGCHSNGAETSNTFARLGLASNAYANIVGVNSFELAAIKRVAPGLPGSSYLFRKLEGTHENLGTYQSPGPGDRMPDGGPYFTPAELNTVSGWISGGALP